MGHPAAGEAQAGGLAHSASSKLLHLGTAHVQSLDLLLEQGHQSQGRIPGALASG